MSAPSSCRSTGAQSARGLLVLADGKNGWLRFDSPDSALVARAPGDVRNLIEQLGRAAADPAMWRVCFFSFEAGVALQGLPPRPLADVPLAVIWECLPPTTGAGGLPMPEFRWRAEWDEERYGSAFERVYQAIVAGDVYQVNLTFRACATEVATFSEVLAPARFTALVKTPELTLWSASPECFLTLDGQSRRIATYPIKGTVATGGRFEALLLDPKERAEHIMIVDMCRNDLGRLCQPGSVVVEKFLGRRDVSYAMHLESAICGHLRQTATWDTILPAMLPAASISGTPKHRALRLISEVETSPRGPYTGVLGWIAPGGDAVFSVLIRTAWRSGGRYWYGTGGGIVADSECRREYAEALLKAHALGSVTT